MEIDGTLLLDQVRSWLARYIRTMNDGDLDLLTVWAVHTHLVAETYTSPRLQLDSPMPGSGKTTCLEHLQRLCNRAVQMATLSSPALLTRMLDVEMRTILIDECDRSLNPEKDGVADLLAVLNSGYKKGATRPVLVPGQGGQWVVKEMPTFAPVAMAGNNPSLPDDTRSRILRVLLLPDLDGTVDESDWELIEPDALQLGRLIAQWADQVREAITTCRPDLPEGITGRFREKWAPLRRVAEMAGGCWPAAVDRLAVADRERHDQDKEDGLITDRPAVVLLRHIAAEWPEGETFWKTTGMVGQLAYAYPETWGERSAYGKKLTIQRLGRMLTQAFGVNSRRPGGSSGPRGYTLGDLSGPMCRLGITPPPVTGRTGPAGQTGLNPDQTTTGSADPAGSTGYIGGGVGEPDKPAKTRNWTRDDLAFPGSTTCKHCGNDLVSQHGTTARCRGKHDAKRAP